MSKGPQKEKRGEVHELKDELNSNSRETQKGALKKVIANMTVGRDVSNLFSDVVRLISSQHIDIKKLVYLYVIANARVQQDRSLHLHGTFYKDFRHESPLVRGLAIRTLSAIQVEKMADHLAAPLRDALRDQDPYVRKCAATAVAKMFINNRQRAEDGGFLQHLQELLGDQNPTVVAHATCALNEIRASTDIDRDLLDLNNRSSNLAVNSLLNALGDMHGCNEWGQVYILDGLATFDAESADKAELICERILSRLQHSNAAVVLSAVRVIMNFIERWCARGTTNEIAVRNYCQKIAPPLVSLVSGGTDFEIRYIALRNITLILQRFPDLLTSQVKVFFVKYNDPIYIKMEKLEIMLILVNHINVRDILSEFNEYAMEVDIEFVRKAVRAIGVTAIKIESAAEECVGVLTQLIKQKVNYVVQEAIIVTRDIFRKYPGRYETIIGLLCDSLESLEDPGAKAAMIWIIGEYSDKIDNADELIEDFADGFDENENIDVRLAILTATVKLFLRRHDSTQELLQKVLKAATDSEVPDLRDRGYIYWRLLSTDPQGANNTVLGMKESIDAEEGIRMDPKLVAELVEHIGTVASVYHKPPESFMASGTYHAARRRPEEQLDDDELDEEQIEHEETGQQLPQFHHEDYTTRGAMAEDPVEQQYHVDPLAPPAQGQAPAAVAAPAGGWDDVLGGPAPTVQTPQPQAEPMQLAIPAAPESGVELQGRFVREHMLFLDIQITNSSPAPLGGFRMQLNSNIWGIALGEEVRSPELPVGSAHRQRLVLSLQGRVQKHEGVPETTIQVALGYTGGTVYGAFRFSPRLFFSPASQPLDKSRWLDLWKNTEREDQFLVDRIAAGAENVRLFVERKLLANGMHLIAQRSSGALHNVYWSMQLITDASCLVEVRFGASEQQDQCTISMRMTNDLFVNPLREWILETLATP